MKARYLLMIALTGMALTIMQGCKSYVRLRYGMTLPKPETPGSLMGFLNKNGYPEENIYVFSDSGLYLAAYRDSIIRKHIPGHMVFDRRGNYILCDTAHCQWYADPVIRALKADSAYTACQGPGLDSILRHIRLISPPAPDDTLKNPDFTFIMFWAKFIGKYNYRIFEMQRSFATCKQARIRVIWLSADPQRSWNLPVKFKNSSSGKNK